MKPASELFAKLHFSETQLNAMQQLYFKYFEKHMPEKYTGTATSALWFKGASWKTGVGYDRGHDNAGFVVEEAENDPLWQHFSDLLPFMEKAAVITKIPAGAIMYPHIDRGWRGEAIYFPISGCSDQCVSEYYDIPKLDKFGARQMHSALAPAVYTYAINTHAYLTATHEWHGVRNLSSQERIVVGWNFNREHGIRTFKNCKNILTRLGYIRDE